MPVYKYNVAAAWRHQGAVKPESTVKTPEQQTTSLPGSTGDQNRKRLETETVESCADFTEMA